MATATKAATVLASQLALGLDDIRVRVRRLRETGDLPAGDKGPSAPHLNVRELAKLFLSAVAGGPQAEAEMAPRQLWDLPMMRRTWEVSKPDGAMFRNDAPTDKIPEAYRGTFGPAMCALIDRAKTAGGRADLLQSVQSISIWQAGDRAAINVWFQSDLKHDGPAENRVTDWFELPADPNRQAIPIAAAPVMRVAQVPTAALLVLADLANDSDHHAAKQISRKVKAKGENDEGATTLAGPAPSNEPTEPVVRGNVEQPHRATPDSLSQEKSDSGESIGSVHRNFKVIEDHHGKNSVIPGAA